MWWNSSSVKVDRQPWTSCAVWENIVYLLKNRTMTIHFIFHLINFIVFCKYMFSVNVMQAAHFKQVRTLATKDWKGSLTGPKSWSPSLRLLCQRSLIITNQNVLWDKASTSLQQGLYYVTEGHINNVKFLGTWQDNGKWGRGISPMDLTFMDRRYQSSDIFIHFL